MISQRWRNLLLFVIILVICYGATFFSIFMISHYKGLVIWLPSGVALAILVMYGLRFWPAIALGVFTATITMGVPVIAALGIVAALITASLIASYFLLRFNFHYQIEHTQDLFILVGGTLLFSAIGSFIALIGQAGSGIIPWSNFKEQWLVMGAGDVTSIIVIAPFLFSWRRLPSLDVKKQLRKLFEAGLLAIILVIWILFFLGKAFREADDFYIFYPLLIWTGLRFGKHGTTGAIFLIVSIITVNNNSYFAASLQANDRLLSLEIGIIIVTIMGLLLAVIVSERRQAENGLKELNNQLEQMVIARTQVLSTEISERTKIEAALRESEERYRSIIENSVDGIVLTNHEGAIQEWNQGLEEITGLKKHQTMGKYLWDIINQIMPEARQTADDYKYIKLAITRILTSKTPVSGKYSKVSFPHPDGGSRTVEIVPFIIESPRKRSLCAIIRDITEREKTTETIMSYVERLQVLHGIDRAILEANSIENLIRTVLPNLQRLMNCQWINYVNKNNENKEITCLGSEIDQQTRQELAASFQSGRDQIPPQLKQGEILLINDLQSLTEVTPLHKFFLNNGLRSLLSVPLSFQNEFYGTIVLGAVKLDAFTREQIDVTRDVANQLAIAIHQAHLIEQIRAGREELRRLTHRVVKAQEEERLRISRELHDDAGQALTALKISLELIVKELPEKSESLRKRLNEAVSLTDNTMTEIRILARGLRPPALDMVGLKYTLEDLCRDFAHRSNLKVAYTSDILLTFPEEINICYYRILQESLTNIYKHAHASQITVNLQYKDELICLVVQDNGKGIERKGSNKNRGIGLLGIQERLEILGGWLEVKSQPGRGTTLSAFIPWNN